MSQSDYYCSQKFWWMTVEPERRTVSSCCSARPAKIDLDWLRSNPGQLFNQPILQREREQMLRNDPVASCEDNCWRPERAGLPSRRTLMSTNKITHRDLTVQPTVLNINLGSDCNLTCSYCCKQYSTAWMRDVNARGAYLPDDDRFTINNHDRMVLRLGQNKIKSSPGYQLLLKEIQNINTASCIEISGGEPFLYNGLCDLVAELNGTVDIFSGLGVNTKRLERVLDDLPDTVTFTISAENVGDLYEFNRYGNSWKNFLRNLQLIERKKFKYRFSSVVSNLTIHGLHQFRQEFRTDRDRINLCTDPDYLSASVLDDISKQLYSQLTDCADTLAVTPSEQQHRKLNQYLNEFARRRNMSLKIFPDHFVNWVNE
jgi:organic radical activating enzyme